MQRKQTRGFWASVTVLLLASVFSLSMAGEKDPAQDKPAQDKVAVVNGSVITQEDFDREMQVAQQWFSSMGKPPSDSQLSSIKEQVLETLISRELLYQASQKKGIKVDETEMNKQFEAMKNRFPNHTGSKDQSEKASLSEATQKHELMRRMAIQEFIDKELAPKVTVSDQETKAVYDNNQDFFNEPEQVRASHILIKVDPKADESKKTEARKKLTEIQQKLKKGEDFSALAKEYSQCPSSPKGGDLGYFTRGQMAKPFEEAAFALGPGKVSDIVETEFGYHLIKVVDKKPKMTVTYEHEKEKLGQYLKKMKVRNEVSKYVKKLQEKAKIERFLTEKK